MTSHDDDARGQPAETESDLAVLRARLASIVDSSNDAILAKDLHGTVTAWNPAAERLYGYTAREMIGQPVETIIPDEHRGESAFFLSEIVAGRRVPPHDTERVTKDGQLVQVSVSVSPICDASGKVVGASTIARDISERLAAEARVAAAESRESELVRELEQTRRLESVGQLAGGVAHDFNNLLAVILNLATFVAEALPEDAPARADAEEIGQTARRAATLTRQLLIFSRRDIAEPEVFDAGALIEGLRNFLTRALGEGIQLGITTDEHLWNVNMDRGQLEQIVVNLAINGRDAMPSGGRLMIETRNTVVDEEFARTRVGLKPGHYVTLTVSDTGVGMPPEVVEHAFEPYFTTKPEGQGTGLGLATVYGIAAKAGGRVALYSEPGRGTSVHTHLPATDALVLPPSGAPVTHAVGAGQRILVVEDAADVRSITERILLGAGYEVVTAAGAAEALEVLASGQAIDLVLTDVVMPHTTGTELVATVRERAPAMKVIFMSGYSHEMLTDEVLSHPGSTFIEKPFTAEQLRTKVSDLLRSGEPAA